MKQNKIIKPKVKYWYSTELKYMIYSDQNLDVKDEILSKIKNKLRNKIKLIEYKDDIIYKYKNGFSLRKIAILYNTNHNKIKQIINIK